MVKKLQVHAADLRGVNRLTIAGISGIVELVEAMHHNIAIIPRMIARPKRASKSVNEVAKSGQYVESASLFPVRRAFTDRGHPIRTS